MTYGWPEFRDVYESGEWEPTTRALINTLCPGDLFVDVGAWIGPTTLWALERGARVIAFEPDPIAAAEFRRTVNHPNVTLHECAVGPTTGLARIRVPDGKEFGGSETQISDVGLKVRIVRLQDVLSEVPALVKIDVEGFEVDLCPDLIPWLSQAKVPVQVSLHGEELPKRLFAGYSDLHWPEDSRGDVVALP